MSYQIRLVLQGKEGKLKEIIKRNNFIMLLYLIQQEHDNYRCLVPTIYLNIQKNKSKLKNIMKDGTHAGYHLFELLPSGQCLISTSSKTKCLRGRFYPWTLNKINTATCRQFSTHFKCYVINLLHLMLCVLFLKFLCMGWWSWGLLSSFIVHCKMARRINK